jgi:hypothetical protein
MPIDYLIADKAVLADLPRPSHVAIDEGFWSRAVATPFLDPADFGRLPTHNRHAARTVWRAAEDRKPILDAMRAEGFASADLRAFAKEVGGQRPAVILHPGMADHDLAAALRNASPATGNRTLGKMWRLLADEMDQELGHSGHVFAGVDPRTRRPALRVVWRRTLHVPDGAPVLAIDASADREIVARFLPGATFHEIKVGRRAHVTQITDMPISKSKLLRNGRGPGRLLDEATGLIEVTATRARTLVVAPKPVAEHLRARADLAMIPADRLAFAHFGALRGLDRFKEFEAVIILGRDQMSVREAEDLAAAIYADDPEPIQRLKGEMLPTKAGFIRMRDGRTVPVDVHTHPDPRVQSIIRQSRERENEQAIDRLRLIHGDSPKEVIVVTNLPLDIEVDVVTTWADLMPSRPERTLARHGVLPLGKTDLHRLDADMYPTTSTARDDLRKGGERLTINSIKRIPPLWKVAYRRAGQSGSACKALVMAATEQEARTRLEGAVGALAAFEVIERPAAPFRQHHVPATSEAPKAQAPRHFRWVGPDYPPSRQLSLVIGTLARSHRAGPIGRFLRKTTLRRNEA